MGRSLAVFLLAVPLLISSIADYVVEGQSVATAKQLRQQLFVTDAYDYRVRPVLNQSDTVYVQVDFYLLAINELSEASETLKTTGYLRLAWTDELLVWNSSDYENIIYAQWPQSEVWKPDIALQNSYHDYKEMGVPSLNIVVRYDGAVLWKPFQVFESTCSIDITYFPFDEQTCSLTFTAWSYAKREVFTRGGSDGMVLDSFQKNSQWDIVSTDWHLYEDSIVSSITFEMTIRRKPLYNLLTIVFPVILLAILDLMTFTTPCSSGEKSGYAITVFLAFAVFLTIIESTFPKNSDTVAYFAIYVIVQTSQSTLITIIALVMIKCSQFEDSVPVPNWVVSLAHLGRFRCGSKCKRRFKNQVKVEKIELKDDIGTVELEDEENDEEPCTWNWALNGVDNLLLMFFTCVLIAVTLGCMLAADTAS